MSTISSSCASLISAPVGLLGLFRADHLLSPALPGLQPAQDPAAPFSCLRCIRPKYSCRAFPGWRAARGGHDADHPIPGGNKEQNTWQRCSPPHRGGHHRPDGLIQPAEMPPGRAGCPVCRHRSKAAQLCQKPGSVLPRHKTAPVQGTRRSPRRCLLSDKVVPTGAHSSRQSGLTACT